MDNFEDMLENSLKPIREGDVLNGTIVDISDEEVLVDLASYTEGVIPKEELSNDPNFDIKSNLKIGDTISATVIEKDDGHGRILLSQKEANDLRAWEVLTKYMQENTVLTVKIGGIVNAGVIAYVEGIRGFIPASKLSLNYEENLEEWLDRQVQVQVIDVNEAEHKLILSAKELLLEQEKEKRNSKIAHLVPGTVVEGKVESLQPYGAFVALENGLTGLIHISQISEKRIKHPSAVLKEGQTVKAKIISTSDGKIGLSMKALLDVTETEKVEDAFEYKETEEASTGLGSLLSQFKF